MRFLLITLARPNPLAVHFLQRFDCSFECAAVWWCFFGSYEKMKGGEEVENQPADPSSYICASGNGSETSPRLRPKVWQLGPVWILQWTPAFLVWYNRDKAAWFAAHVRRSIQSAEHIYALDKVTKIL